ncbi:hypothetical protein [Brevundimonas sp.]|uniref:hypothetical protein n=1 Tax=Brevundimonas sp. TaxID=1871086 RepID=UPI0035170DA9
MAPWIRLLGPWLVWGLHFGLIYGIGSIFVLQDASQGLASRTSVLLASLVCLAALGGLLVWSVRDRQRLDGAQLWVADVGIAGAVLAGVAVIWQSFPALFV